MGRKFMYVLVVVMICGSSNAGVVHKVGDSYGWTNLILYPPNPSYYKSWTASKHFRVGDTILFEYNEVFHNVVRVTHRNFKECNSTAPYATWTTGNDSFAITRPGHYYFICGVQYHCWAGQKIDILVLSQDKNSSGPSSSPPHSSGPTPAVSASPSHPPKKSASSFSLNSDLKLWLCVVAMSLAAIGV